MGKVKRKNRSSRGTHIDVTHRPSPKKVSRVAYGAPDARAVNPEIRLPNTGSITSPYSEADYDSERKILVDGEYRACESFNKYLIAIISGTLALTITFIEKIVQHPAGVPCLIVGYSALTLALVFALAAFLLEQFAWRHQLKLLDDIHEGRLTIADARRDPRAVAPWSQGLLIAAFIVFGVGLTFTIGFICRNISTLSASSQIL